MKTLLFMATTFIAAAAANSGDEKAIVLASNLLSTQQAGNITVSDLVLDLRNGYVAAVTAFIEKPNTEITVHRLIPFQLLRGDILAGIEQCPECTNEPVTRQTIEHLFVDFNLKAYWEEEELKKAQNSLPRSDPEFMLFTKLDGKKVHGKENEPLGTITDIAVKLDSGKIVYCVLKSNETELRAIPLGAFSRLGVGRKWEIELTKDAVMAFKPFDPAAPPIEVDGGWIEYVAVRYGRDALQTDPQKADN